jgi:hypothetical protein
MRRILTVVILLGVLPAPPARADEAESPVRAILDKAIEAHGGKDVLTRYKGMVTKSKGQFFGLALARERSDPPIDYASTGSFQAPDRLRMEATGRQVRVDRTGRKVITLTAVRVINGDRGWRIINGKEEVLPRDQMDEAREQMHLTLVTRLVPLLDKEYQLAVVGEGKVEGRTVVGLRVSRKDYRDIQLFFDKETGLLRVSRVRVKDLYNSSKESIARTVYSRYRKVKGMQVAYKVVTYYDEEPYIEYEVTEATPVEKLDDRLFRKPEAKKP